MKTNSLRVSSTWFSKGVTECPKQSLVVVIDALRFSCTIVRALEYGIREIIVVSSPEELLRYSGCADTITAGEVNGVKIPGADTDNSPSELKNILAIKKASRLVIRTTSGAQVFLQAINNKHPVVVCSFINAESVARYITGEERDVCVVMAGYKNRFFALDDFLAAGYLAKLLEDNANAVKLDEQLVAAKLAFLSIRSIDMLRSIIIKTESYKVLEKTGKTRDVYECIDYSALDVLPLAIGGPVIKRA